MEDLKSHNKAEIYRDYLLKKKIIKSNKSEMGSLLDILGICGILSSNNYPCYDVKFADITWRAPVEHTNEFSFPLNRWQVKDGVNTERFQKFLACSTQNEHSYRVVLNCGLFIFIATKLLAHAKFYRME